MNDEADQYEVVEFPAIFNENTPEERALWPEWMPLSTLRKTKASMPLVPVERSVPTKPHSRRSKCCKERMVEFGGSKRPTFL